MTTTAKCPHCDDGRVLDMSGPGYFDSGFGNFLPTETETDCEACGGTGEITVCAGCGEPDCECDDD